MSAAGSDVASWTTCWRLERRDGATIGLTAHDRDLMVDGLLHRAAPGLSPSAVTLGDGLDAAAMDVTGALTHAAITEADLLAGRWDGARVAVTLVDWRDPATVVPLCEGRIGAVELKDGGFAAALDGPAARLDRPVAEETSPDCRAELGDRRCRVAMAARTRFARVAAAEGVRVTLDRTEPVPDGWGHGRLRWFGGANAGLAARVLRSEGAVVTLAAAPPFPVVAGTLVEIAEGCDRTLATCAGRFGNAANFRGEPYLPGIDLLTRYPGQ